MSKAWVCPFDGKRNGAWANACAGCLSMKPKRTMPDGSPCWCESDHEPHEGWIHGSRCDEARTLLSQP